MNSGRCLGFLNRLGREPEVLAHVLRRFPLQMRHFVTELVHRPVEPPQMGVTHDQAPSWMTIFSPGNRSNTPSHMSVATWLRPFAAGRHVVLEVVRRPTGTGHLVVADTARMEAHRELVMRRRLEQRPILGIADRLLGAERELDMDEVVLSGTVVDLLDCQIGLLKGEQIEE